MKNKHTLANKKKVPPVIDIEQLKTWTKQLEKQIPQEIKDTKEDNNYSSHIAEFAKKIELPKVYTKWWQKLLSWITFGLYKPATFWYKIKPVKK